MSRRCADDAWPHARLPVTLWLLSGRGKATERGWRQGLRLVRGASKARGRVGPRQIVRGVWPSCSVLPARHAQHVGRDDRPWLPGFRVLTDAVRGPRPCGSVRIPARAAAVRAGAPNRDSRPAGQSGWARRRRTGRREPEPRCSPVAPWRCRGRAWARKNQSCPRGAGQAPPFSAGEPWPSYRSSRRASCGCACSAPPWPCEPTPARSYAFLRLDDPEAACSAASAAHWWCRNGLRRPAPPTAATGTSPSEQ